MYIIFLITQLIATSTSTQFFLLPSTSIMGEESQAQTQVPEAHDHPFSCELIFFNVQDNRFRVKITEISNSVAVINLTAWTNNATIRYNSLKKISFDNNVVFCLQFVSMANQKNLEIIMNFDTTYYDEHGAEVMKEQRKAYILFCEVGQDYYVFRLPRNTIVITTIIGLLLMLTLPWNIQYRKYLPITYNLLTSSIEILILIIATYLQMIFGNTDTVFTIQRAIMGVIELICMVIYTQDLLMLVIQRSNIALAIGFCFTLTVMGLDNFLGLATDAWFLNDIIAVMIAGAVVKFVIIRKMKTAVWGLGLMWVFCLFREFAKQFHLQKFDQGFGIRILPIFVQLPTYWIDDSSSLSCSAFGSSKIICFGIILNFCKRIDLYLSTQFYRVLACSLTVLCVAAQLIFNLTVQELPTIEVMSVLLFYPVMVGLLLFFANKRGEWAEIWHGGFYDMAANRASIERSVCFEGLQQQFGNDLIVNASIRYGGTKMSDKQNMSKITLT